MFLLIAKFLKGFGVHVKDNRWIEVYPLSVLSHLIELDDEDYPLESQHVGLQST